MLNAIFGLIQKSSIFEMQSLLTVSYHLSAAAYKHRVNLGNFVGGFASHWAVAAQARRIERRNNEYEFRLAQTTGKRMSALAESISAPATNTMLQ